MRLFFLVSGLLFLGPLLPAQSPSRYATRVAAFQRGPGPGIFKTSNVLGPPRGSGYKAGSTHVLSLGAGGSVTLGFDVEIADGPGADFLVFENPFYAGRNFSSFAELFFVEVSTNGKDFTRFPAVYHGPSRSPGAFGTLPMGCCSNLGGITPVLADPARRPGLDPFDPCLAGGDPFDLADLKNDPLVKAGKVDLGRIRFVRLVDIVSGKEKDSLGKTIYDPGGPTGSADIDAVAVIHYRKGMAPRGPRVELFRSKNTVRVVFFDPDGLSDLDPSSLHASLNAYPVPAAALLGYFKILSFSATRVEFALSGIPPGFFFTIGFSVRDKSGAFSGARR